MSEQGRRSQDPLWRYAAGSRARWLLCIVWLLPLLCVAQRPQEDAGTGTVGQGGNPPLRVGVSARTMSKLNPNDLTAAMTVWIDNIATKRGIAADPKPHLFYSVEDLIRALKEGEVDLFSAPSDEFVQIEKAVPLTGYYTTRANGSIVGTCVLLVRADSPYQTVSDLRGKRLMKLTHPRAELAPIWLETRLLQDGLPASKDFFSEVDQTKKLNSAILPVFFSQTDACLVTKAGFEMAGELNPQVRAQLRILASSDPLIPGIGSARASINPGTLHEFREAAFHLSDSVSGQHILNLFQCEAIVTVTPEEFAPTRSFLEKYEQLTSEMDGTVALLQEGTP